MILNYNVKLEVLGPLFIGSGERIEKSEYIYDKVGSRIYIMDKLKMFKGLREIGYLKKYEKEVMSNNTGMRLSDFIEHFYIKPSVYSKWATYSYNIDKKHSRDVGRMQIMTFVKDAYNRPYVPGSSLKGAIRNAVLNALLIENENKEIVNSSINSIEETNKRIEGRKINKDKYLLGEAKDIERNLFIKKTHAKDEYSIFKGLIIGDSKPLDVEDMILCQKCDVFPKNQGKNKAPNSLPIQRECIKPKTIIEFPVEIDTAIFNYDEKKLYDSINMMYNIERDNFLSKFSDTQIENKNTKNLIYLGGGVGFVSKTAVYSLYHSEPKRGLKVASKILDNVDSPKPNKRGENKKMGNHLDDPEIFKVSPHVRKCTMYKNKLYDFGLCRIDFQPI